MTVPHRICLITSAHLSANPRVVKEADALSQAGYDVTVIAATYQAKAREADKVFADRPWRTIAPAPFGPDAPRGRRIVQLTRSLAARTAISVGLRTPAALHASLHPVTPDLARVAMNTPADLYIAHLSALPAAALAARRHRALYAFDAEDFHPGELGDEPKSKALRIATAAIERTYLPGCAYITAASPGIAGAYREAYDLPWPTVVLNVFPRALAPATPTPEGSARPAPSVYWFSQTIGPDRGLEAAVRALALAKSRPHLYLRGAPSVGYAARLAQVAAQAGVADHVHLLEPRLPDEMAALASQFDVGLAGETGHTRNRQIALTNKLFTYFLAGIPAIASDIEAHRAFVGAGLEGMILYRGDDPAALAEAMDRYLTNPALLAAARSAAFRLGQERYNWDIAKQVLLDRVDRVLNDRSRPSAGSE